MNTGNVCRLNVHSPDALVQISISELNFGTAMCLFLFGLGVAL